MPNLNLQTNRECDILALPKRSKEDTMTYSGEKIKELRIKQHISREELCGDESELSVRQLARIESNQSMPTVGKLLFIANKLNISVGTLVDSEKLELPERYKELKYLILRKPMFTDKQRLLEREAYFDEIAISFYDKLPEEEKIIIDCLQSRHDVYAGVSTKYGTEVLSEYFDQVQAKNQFTVNDVIFVELYISCVLISHFDSTIYHKTNHQTITDNLIAASDYFPIKDLFILNNAILNCLNIPLSLGNQAQAQRLLNASKKIMDKTQDYYKLPILKLLEWKYYLQFFNDVTQAEKCYLSALKSAQNTSDTYLEEKISKEWQNDLQAIS